MCSVRPAGKKSCPPPAEADREDRGAPAPQLSIPVNFLCQIFCEVWNAEICRTIFSSYISSPLCSALPEMRETLGHQSANQKPPPLKSVKDGAPQAQNLNSQWTYGSSIRPWNPDDFGAQKGGPPPKMNTANSNPGPVNSSKLIRILMIVNFGLFALLIGPLGRSRALYKAGKESGLAVPIITAFQVWIVGATLFATALFLWRKAKKSEAGSRLDGTLLLAWCVVLVFACLYAFNIGMGG